MKRRFNWQVDDYVSDLEQSEALAVLIANATVIDLSY